ncbi:PH domain-containing protein [Winogradskyella ludwigii]|uniref:PH domain-containing protein n=1 Tax=Winogradskyella ludwigii TaxID=2686076 RepID=UPI0015CA0B65|nr:PH domain-containing protein [Winogradskyella ludwigii]
MIFRSKKDNLFTITILGLNAFLIGITIYGFITGELEKDEYWTLIPILGVVVLLFWMFFGTNYQLSKNELIYRCGPIKGKIKINRITEIIKGKTLWVGLKPATSRKGLIIKYDKYNEIYISPITNESFIAELLKLKSDIKIND